MNNIKGKLKPFIIATKKSNRNTFNRSSRKIVPNLPKLLDDLICLCIRGLNTVKLMIVYQIIYRIKSISIKILAAPPTFNEKTDPKI